jgi:hypothetical protein
MQRYWIKLVSPGFTGGFIGGVIGGLTGGAIGLMAGAAQADEPITLTAGAAEVQGVTADGDRTPQSLTQLASRDRRRKLCLGYSTTEPGHTFVLSENQPRLQVAVESEGRDTTLLIQGPRGIDCNDNARRGNRDAAITDSDWPAGTYQIWVGAFNPGDTIDYVLRIDALDADTQPNRLTEPVNRTPTGVGRD